nr:outer membrane protein [uncultured Cohaesibacter sp.]
MSVSVAYAADLPAPPIIEYEPEVPIEIGSGWYLRGDLGAAIYQGGSATAVGPGYKVDFYDEKIDNGWLAGVGVGYYFNEKFRGDLTVDYHGKAKYKGLAPCLPAGSGCPSTERLDFSAWTLMLNGYYDIGTWHSITPYVGAGAGLAYLRTTDYDTTRGSTFANKAKFNFAWNVMAGAAFNITDNLKFDANYRLMSFGQAKTGGPSGTSSATHVGFDDLYAHEFRVGLRYDLN